MLVYLCIEEELIMKAEHRLEPNNVRLGFVFVMETPKSPSQIESPIDYIVDI